jgi:hypothetical protein
MTVKELIAALQKYPPDTRVVVLGYESGYDDVTLVKQIAIMPETKPVWYKGRYDEAPPEKAKADQAIQAVLVYGRNAEK